MSRTQEERIDDALSQLVDRTLPSLPNEDESVADQRFYRAIEAAREIIDNENNPSVASDANHIAELIKQKLLRQHDNPDAVQTFSNLFSRLLGQPVLSKKWAILFLMYQLSEDPKPKPPVVAPQILAARSSAPQPRPESAATPASTRKRGSAEPRRSSLVFDEAFSRSGLTNLPTPQERERPRRQFPYSPKDRQAVNGDRKVNGEAKAPATKLAANDLVLQEPALLRDLPFTLQGVSSTNMIFNSNTSLTIPTNLPVPIVSMLYALAEPSLLYKGLTRFLESSDGGLVGQSLRAAIGIETRSYLGLVASLEGQIRRALTMLDEPRSKKSLGKAGVTLKRCVIWTREATLGLRLMSLIVDESRARKGGQVISLIHSFASSHGDPFVGSFAERLLAHVTRPFYDMLRLWIYDGELQDPYLEFFVSEQHNDHEYDGGKGGATSVWEDKYKLNKQMIPSIITEEFANKVFLIGKSLNFIRYGCGDSSWVDNYSKDKSRELRYGDGATLEVSIDEAYKTTMARLIHLMDDKFKLMEHLTALKNYLLLGRGDFISLLMESLSENLDRPANSQYRHTLTAQLEHAIRNSNAQYDSPEVLRRLDARMLELSHGEIGWDVFTLEYKIDAPVDVVITPYGSKQYLKVFNFLWRVKRVEYALGSTWRRCMTGARGVLGSVDDKVGKDWKSSRCVVAEMIHFINQLQYYILFEVIEASWDRLQNDIATPGATLDDLIKGHSNYLNAITRKGLLGSTTLDFPTQLHELLKIMLAYRDAVDGLYSFSVAEFTRRQQKSARIETRTRQGKWGITERDDEIDDAFGDILARSNKKLPRSRDADSPLPPPLLATAGAGPDGASTSNDASVLPALRQRLGDLAVDFHARVSGLLGDLASQPDPDMRFLGVVMNFNDTYTVVRKSRRRQVALDKDTDKKKTQKGKERKEEGKVDTSVAPGS